MINDWLDQLNRAPTQLRPAVWIGLLLLSGLALYSAILVIKAVKSFPPGFTWRMSFRAVGWAVPAISASATLLLIWVVSVEPKDGPLAGLPLPGIISLVVPLMAGCQAALLFSPDDEPVLELKLAAPRPLVWLISERIGLTFAFQTLIGLLGTALIATIQPLDPFQNLLGWLPALALFVGVGVRVGLSIRQPLLALILVIGLCFVTWLFGPGLALQFPAVWPLHPFLPVIDFQMVLRGLTQTEYRLNRLLISLIGLGLVISACTEARSEERILTGHSPIRMTAQRRIS